jgi:hypothetical protein
MYIEEKPSRKEIQGHKSNFWRSLWWKDSDDEYMYWINKETRKIDHLAYSYKVTEVSALELPLIAELLTVILSGLYTWRS